MPINDTTVLRGNFTMTSLPSASDYKGRFAFVTDSPGGASFYQSDGALWNLAKGTKGDKGDTGATGATGPSGISKRIDTYDNLTDVNGVYTQVFTTPFTITPHVNFQLLSTDPNVVCTMTAVSSTGFSCKVQVRSSTTLLSTLLALTTFTNVQNARVYALAVER